MINNVKFFDVDEFVVCPDCGRVYKISELLKDEDGCFICEDCKIYINSKIYKLEV